MSNDRTNPPGSTPGATTARPEAPSGQVVPFAPVARTEAANGHAVPFAPAGQVVPFAPSARTEAAGGKVVPFAPAAPGAATPSDLEQRVNARRQELLAHLAELKDDQSASAAEIRERARTRLSELRHIIRESVIHGWANITDVARARVGRWLAR